MSKRTTIFLSLLALVTALLSVVFILSSFFVDQLTDNVTVSMIFEELRTAFDLIAEYTALGVVIYAFCRYKPKEASRSLFIALGSFLFCFLFQIGATAVTELKSVDNFFGRIFWFTLFGLVGLIVERIIPCLVIALISFLCTRKGTKRITKIFSFKNPIQRSMLFSALVIYLVNAVPTLFLHIFEIVDIGGTQNMYWEEFLLNYIIPHILIVVYNLLLVYGVFLIVYFICKKHEEKAPIKKSPKIVNLPEQNNTPMEEK